jgi:hypothetical protein
MDIKETTDDARHQQDSDLADALLRILKSARGKELRDKIREVCK